MRALLRKELWQVLPAHLLVAVLFTVGWFLVADPREVLAPFDSGDMAMHLVLGLVFILEGAFLGFGQFSMERWARTEAYLVHRATGHRAAFQAKVLAGFAALGVVIVLPPLVYGVWYLGVDPEVVDGAPRRLLFAMAASCTGLAGYAVGVFASLLRRGWLARTLFAVLGALSILQFSMLATIGAAQSGGFALAYFFAAQLLLAGILLAVSFAMFRAGEDQGRPWPRVTSMLSAALAIGLFLPLLAHIPRIVGFQARNNLLSTYPHVVADESGALYVATPWEPGRRPLDSAPDTFVTPYRTGYDLVDAAGQSVPEALALSYDGGASPHSTFKKLFAASYTPLHLDSPPQVRMEDAQPRVPFGYDRPWVALMQSGGARFLDLSSGELWLASDSGLGRASWRRIAGLPASVEVIEPLGWNGGRKPLFLDPAQGRLWAVENYGDFAQARFVELNLPAGDRVVGLEPLNDLEGARSGLYSSYHANRARLVVGEQGLYAWMDSAELLPWTAVPADKRSQVIAQRDVPAHTQWRLLPSNSDGLAFRLEVQDARSGAVGLVHEFRPTGPGQQRKALYARASVLLAAPLASLVAWSSVPDNPRDLQHAVEGWFNDPLLVGRQRTWILAVVLALTAVMALSTWQRMSTGNAQPGLKLLWCGAVCVFGWSAYVLFRVLEPQPRRAIASVPARTVEAPALVIQTAWNG